MEELMDYIQALRLCNTGISVPCQSYTPYCRVPHKYSHQGMPNNNLIHFSESSLTKTPHAAKSPPPSR